MTDQTCWDLQITNQVLNWDVSQLERLVDELLVRVTVLEGTQGNLIKIPDSLALIPIPLPESNLLVKIVDGIDDDMAQVIVEDQAGVSVTEGRAFGIDGEIFEEGEDMYDVLWQVVARDQEIPRYPKVPGYDDLNYIPDRQE